MSGVERIYVLGGGAIGFPLAVHLVNHGRPVTVVRTSTDDVSHQTVEITVRNGEGRETGTPVTMVSLSRVEKLFGIIAITAKSYANGEIASRLKGKRVAGPVVIMQNGLGVERPYVEAGAQEVYRCILYVTSGKEAHNTFSFRPVTASPIGIIQGSGSGLRKIVQTLSTVDFPFRAEGNIRRETWKKAIINSVFNSICPLLDADNGVFRRDADAAEMAREIVAECIQVTDRLGIGLTEREILEQIHTISAGSEGQLISTLQDIRNGRETEIASLNLEIGRLAEDLAPPVLTKRTTLLGNLVALKSRIHRRPGDRSGASP